MQTTKLIVRLFLTGLSLLAIASVSAGLVYYFVQKRERAAAAAAAAAKGAYFAAAGDACTALPHLSTNINRKRCSPPLICSVQTPQDEEGIYNI